MTYLSPFKGCVEVSVEVFYDAGRRDGVVRPCRHACRSRRLGHLDYFIKYHLPPSRTGLSGVGTRSHLALFPYFFRLYRLYCLCTVLNFIDSPTSQPRAMRLA